MRVAHRACRALWVQPRLPAPAALGCHARALCTSAESAESVAAAAARKAAFEAHEAKTGRVMSTVDRKDAADQAKLLFKKALAMVEASHGRRQMIFPKDILWLAGAPGAGKGTLTPHIMEMRSLTQQPIEVSSLLTRPELQAKKERGELVSDEEVLTPPVSPLHLPCITR